MKGLGYELVLFLLVVVFLVFYWIIGYENFSRITDVFIGLSQDEDLDTHLGQLKQGMYFSLFFLIILGFIWVIKSAQEERGIYYSG